MLGSGILFSVRIHQVRYIGQSFLFAVLCVLFYVEVNKQTPILPYVAYRPFGDVICIRAYVRVLRPSISSTMVLRDFSLVLYTLITF